MTDPLDIEAAAREAIEQAGRATPGPWKCEDPVEVQLPDPNWDWHHIRSEGGHGVASVPYPSDQWTREANASMKHNGPWIAAARTREPLLAAEVLRLRAWMRWMSSDTIDCDLWSHGRFGEALSGAPAPRERA